jgi:hypothetical protein
MPRTPSTPRMLSMEMEDPGTDEELGAMYMLRLGEGAEEDSD